MKFECVGCGKPPEEIDEFILYAKIDSTTPREAMIKHEATYNPENGRFCCILCYIAMGKIGRSPERATSKWRELMPKNGGKHEENDGNNFGIFEGLIVEAADEMTRKRIDKFQRAINDSFRLLVLEGGLGTARSKELLNLVQGRARHNKYPDWLYQMGRDEMAKKFFALCQERLDQKENKNGPG